MPHPFLHLPILNQLCCITANHWRRFLSMQPSRFISSSTFLAPFPVVVNVLVIIAAIKRAHRRLRLEVKSVELDSCLQNVPQWWGNLTAQLDCFVSEVCPSWPTLFKISSGENLLGQTCLLGHKEFVTGCQTGVKMANQPESSACNQKNHHNLNLSKCILGFFYTDAVQVLAGQ